jgi:hypothetical protein
VNRTELIEYILANSTDYSKEEILKAPLATLVIIKVQIELEIENKKRSRSS